MKKGTRISEHLRKIDELSDQLEAIRERVSEVLKVAVLLQSVQETYPTLVTALSARGDDELTLVFVKQALLDEEQRRVKPSDLSVSSEDLALQAGHGRTRVSGSITCFNCGKKGHFARDCLKSKSAKQHHQVKKAEKQEDSESDSGGGNEMFVAQVGLTASAQSSDWIIDSGASCHMTIKKNVLQGYREFEASEPVGLGDGRTAAALGVGKVKVTTQLHNGKKVGCWISDVLYVPKLTTNLLSVHSATAKGNTMSFKHESCHIQNKKEKVIGNGSLLCKLYKLDCAIQPVTATVAGVAECVSMIDLWHQRLDHVNHGQLLHQAEISDLQLQGKLSFREACIKGKCHRLPHLSQKTIKSKEKLQLVYTDVCGPMQTQSFGGSRYFITFTDDYSW